jgi:hypothetical protein
MDLWTPSRGAEYLGKLHSGDGALHVTGCFAENTLSGEHKFLVFKKKVLRKIFKPKMDDSFGYYIMGNFMIYTVFLE